MRRGSRNTAVPVILVVLLVAGLVALFAGSSHGLQSAGFVVVVAVVGVVLLATAPMRPTSRGSILGLGRRKQHPDYVATAATPSEDDWAHEQQSYDEAEAERDDG